MPRHVTQRDIIVKLMYAKTLRYSDIKPELMSGNQFAYHLGAVIRDGLVEKRKTGEYALTLEGQRLSDKLSRENFRRLQQPIYLVMVLASDSRGKIIWHRRARQPFSGVWNLPNSKVRFEESPLEAARRLLKLRVGVPDELLGEVSVVSLRVISNDEPAEVITNQIILIYSVPVADGSETPPVIAVESTMATLNALEGQVMPGLADAVRRIRRGEKYVDVTVRY